MKITFIGHASMLVEAGGLRILSDPWYEGPSFGQQWWAYPRPRADLARAAKVDWLYLSHGHNDHLHFDTLGTLPRDIKVLVSSKGDLAGGVRDLGFTVVEVKPDEEYALSPGVKVRLVPTHNDDTLLAIDDGREVCLNLNDALHSSPRDVQESFIARLKAWYPRGIDYAFCGYGIASHFPNCYRIPGKDMAASAGERQKFFNREWARIIASLAPRAAFPFAADVAFLEDDLAWANEPTQNTERPLAALRSEHPGYRGAAYDIAPGFEITDGKVTRDVQRQPMDLKVLRTEMASEVLRANEVSPVTAADVEELAGHVRTNVEACRSYLEVYPRDWSFLIRLRGGTGGVTVTKRGTAIAVATVTDADAARASADITLTTRLAYVRASLTEPYGDELIFVGSGGVFEFRDAADARENLQREFATIVRRHERPLVRPAASFGLIATAKHIVRKIVRPPGIDLYDLGRWTVFR